MSNFWSSLFGGSNSTLNKDISNFGNIGGFAQNLGQSNTAAGSQFWQAITSGDQSKIAKTLAPEFSAISGSAQQAKNATAQFGNRSGGNNASMQSIGDKTRAQKNDLVSGLMGQGANALLSSGTSLLGTSLSAYGNQTDASQLQMQNWSNSIFGQGLTKGAGFGEGFALGKV